LRHRIQDKLADTKLKQSAAEPVTIAASKKPFWRLTAIEWCVIGGICCALLVLFLLPGVQGARESSRSVRASNNFGPLASAKQVSPQPYDRVVIQEE